MAAREEEFDRGVQHGSVDHKVTASAEKGGKNRHALGGCSLHQTRIFSVLPENELRRLANDVVLENGEEELQIEEEAGNALPERLGDDV